MIFFYIYCDFLVKIDAILFLLTQRTLTSRLEVERSYRYERKRKIINLIFYQIMMVRHQYVFVVTPTLAGWEFLYPSFRRLGGDSVVSLYYRALYSLFCTQYTVIVNIPCSVNYCMLYSTVTCTVPYFSLFCVWCSPYIV